MLLYTRHTYVNKLKEGAGLDCGLYHESKERALLAAKGNESNYDAIAEHRETKEYRCDACLEHGIYEHALPHRSGRDLCKEHRIKADKVA